MTEEEVKEKIKNSPLTPFLCDAKVSEEKEFTLQTYLESLKVS